MLGKWHIEHVRCWGCEDVGDVEYWEFGMFRIPDDGDVGCSGYGMSRMWTVQDVERLGCGMLGGWDVRDMGCGMWDVCRDLG